MPRRTTNPPPVGRWVGAPQTRTRRLRAQVGAILTGLAVLGAAGCSGSSGEPAEAPTLEVTSAAPTLSSDSPDLNQVAAEVIGGYRQTIVDLYNGRVADVDELKKYASGKRWAEDKRTIPDALAAGRSATIGEIEVVWLEKTTFDSSKGTMTVLACIDAGQISFTDEQGTAKAGRDLLKYQLDKDSGDWTIVSVVLPTPTPSRKC